MKAILHFIDSLGMGGAETLLMSYIQELPQYRHVLVICSGPNAFEEITNSLSIYNLDLPVSKKNMIGLVRKLKVIIKNEKIDIVHSHSYWTNIIARLAAPKTVAVVNHYHFADYDTLIHSRKVRAQLRIDKLVKHPRLYRVAVSEYVQTILNKQFPGAANTCIPNFIHTDHCISMARRYEARTPMRLVAVGSTKKEKGYGLLVDVFQQLKDYPVTMDVYGDGAQRQVYINNLKEKNITALCFPGALKSTPALLNRYDVYCSTSFSETFGMALLEAMCAGMPLLVPDIPAFREIAPATAIFFESGNEADLLEKILLIYNNGIMTTEGQYADILNRYSKPVFINALDDLYKKVSP